MLDALVLFFIFYGFSLGLAQLFRPVIEEIRREILISEMDQHRRYMNEQIWHGDKG